MKASLLPMLRCPECYEPLALATDEWRGDEVWQGGLTCQGAGHYFAIQNGLPLLYVDDDRWTVKAREADGWVALHKSLDIYETGPESVDHDIPFTDEEPWPQIGANFKIALQRLNLSGTETVLDLGAGRGWAAKHFAQLGCQVVALDIVPDKRIGLGRSTALMERVGTYFDRVIGDGENLPFIDSCFDLVFCSAALHHSSELKQLCVNIGRVLRQGGRLCAINEPAIGLLDNEQAVLARDTEEEARFGINETRPSLLAYVNAFAAGAMQLTHLSSPLLDAQSSAALEAQAANLGAILPRLAQTPMRTSYYQFSEFVRKRLAARRHPGYQQAYQLLPAGLAPLSEKILFWGGGELLMIAERAER